jgi:uncharacterized linocin/CFP29 family protein
MCILFSFPASGGAADELNLVREDVVLVNSKSAQDLSYVTGFDVAIGYVKAGTNKVQRFSQPMLMDTRGRTFVALK